MSKQTGEEKVKNLIADATEINEQLAKARALLDNPPSYTLQIFSDKEGRPRAFKVESSEEKHPLLLALDLTILANMLMDSYKEK